MSDIRSFDFGAGFAWGISTAAYQIEGAHRADGKGPSIWDDFVKLKGRILGGQNGNTACDFYNTFTEDNKLIKSLNIPNHRFSISWSRILPEGTGTVNKKGIDYYNRVIDNSLSLGIEPWITLYHWDLPLKLQLLGGWTSRDIVDWFQEFVKICITEFGDRVKKWMILNEPMVFTGAGYFLGKHAPGKKGLENFLPAVHHAVLCQSLGGRLVKSLDNNAQVGTTFSSSLIEPYRHIRKDIAAAVKVDALLNRMFIEPLLGLGYPVSDLSFLRKIEKYMKSGDEDSMAFDMDFIGIQNYTREIVKHSLFTPFVNGKIVSAKERNVERTVMDWEVYPPALYHILMKFSAYKNIPRLIVTENGAAFPDRIINCEINDSGRREFLKENIRQMYRAMEKGCKVDGYFAWTLMDNFEWAEGYHPRFGIIHVDHYTQKEWSRHPAFGTGIS